MWAVYLNKWEMLFNYDGNAKVVRSSSPKVVEEGASVSLDELSENVIDGAHATEMPPREDVAGDPNVLDLREEAEHMELEEEYTNEESEEIEDAMPKHYFYFTNDYFIECRTGINDATRCQSKCREAWTSYRQNAMPLA